MDQRHEIIRYAKSRLPVFMNQLHRFLISLKATLNSMSPTQRLETATYLIPEVCCPVEILQPSLYNKFPNMTDFFNPLENNLKNTPLLRIILAYDYDITHVLGFEGRA